ncbi:NAD(P)-dependent oxidoreductase [Halorubrum sp. AJ67]|uniref:NAD-dependent epimerase/dehydratase family protein n=1 Tax=Halorubrum sp. AJ67 TaxID=1173487 RepID=UPI0003DCCC82|nr:NAD-dependent epimerase/dehydratase family protein [Halorubrum sp. AJ67]CDK40714.1 nucleoside-diphosphate-sugar epimerase [Halorubrum sp. AJ67]
MVKNRHSMVRVLVTGSSGFIGMNLCTHLVEEGYEVHGADIEPPEFEHPSSVEERRVDLLSEPELPDVDVIVHLAAHSQVQSVVEDSNRAIENLKMTRHVLEEAVRMGADVVNASSRDVYGSAIRPSEDEVSPDSPNGYAASKLGGEALANAYAQNHDIRVVSLRLANVYGPKDTNRRVIPIFASRAAAGEKLKVFGEGKLLDFIHVDDVCDAIVAAMNRIDVADGESFNVGSGDGTPLKDVARMVSEIVDECPGWELDEDRSGDVSRYVSDNSKANSVLGFEPKKPIEEELEDTIKWYLDAR